MKTCPYCNTQCSDNDVVCPQCGASLDADIQIPSQEQPQTEHQEYANPKYDEIYNTPSNNPQVNNQPNSQVFQQGEQYNNSYNQSYYQSPQQVPVIPQNKQKDKLVAGLLGILLGSLGIHKFYLGYSSTGVAMLLISLLGGLCSFGIATVVIQIIGLIEGVTYLTKSDEEFQQIYVANEKKWF